MVKINHRIEISLERIMREGRFEYIELGMTRDEFFRTFPAPDGLSEEAARHEDILQYGCFEMFFASDSLWLLQTSQTTDMTFGGESLIIDPWIFTPGRRWTLGDLLPVLSNEALDYRVRFCHVTRNVDVVTAGGGKLLFCDTSDHRDADPADRTLERVGLAQPTD